MNFDTLSVGKRLAFLILAAAAGLTGISVVAWVEMDHVYEAAGYAQINTVPSLILLSEVQRDFTATQTLAYESLLTTDEAQKAALTHTIELGHTALTEKLKQYEPLISDRRDREMLDQERTDLGKFDAARENALGATGDRHAAQPGVEVLRHFSDAARKMDDALEALRAYNVQLGQAGANEANTTISRARMVLTLITLSTLFVVVILGTWMTRKLLRQLGADPNYLCEVAAGIAKGDLATHISMRADDRLSVLHAVKKMRDSLGDIVRRVQLGADAIATGSGQIASGNQDLSSRTEQQAASLQETASSMEELTATVKQNAENAQQASALASDASEVARKGSVVVGQVVETMTDIGQSSSKIAEITGIIEGIAFQTNILALNAAVEAARAGEQGRGFAVVASEVRSLAQRSSSAAKEIKDLISSSVLKIQSGSALADDAGRTMTEVTRAVARATDIMGEIAAASGEQSRGIGQVNVAISQMDEVTQQNAALVEEAAAASQSLEDQGRQLIDAVSFFRLAAIATSPATSTRVGRVAQNRC